PGARPLSLQDLAFFREPDHGDGFSSPPGNWLKQLAFIPDRYLHVSYLRNGHHDVDRLTQIDDVTDGADHGIFGRGHLIRTADIHPLRSDRDVTLRPVFQFRLIRYPERHPGSASGPISMGAVGRSSL